MEAPPKMTYAEFLRTKVATAPVFGFTPKSEPHPCLFPHQRDIARWMVHGGRRANFSSFGLGKTRTHLQVAKWCVERDEDLAIDYMGSKAHARKYLIVAPLGCRKDPFTEEAPKMGMELTYVRTNAEVDAAPTAIVITNYERVRDGNITIATERFCGAGLDEASVLRSYGSKTYQSFLKLFADIHYRFVFTATPSPNRHKELIHYAGYLGVMDTGQALTRFFQRDSSKANNLTLYPHMEERFWEWLASWAVFMQRPSDLGYSDEGYDFPPLQVHWHCVPVDHKKAWAMIDSWGQRQLFLDKSSGLKELSEIKTETMATRLVRAMCIMGEKPDAHWLLWHDLEAERHLIEAIVPNVKTAYGSQDLEEREETILGFSRGTVKVLASKPSICGSGCNFQKHCSDAIFLGASYKFNDFIQSVHRIARFQQENQVNIHVIYSESEDPVISALKHKWTQHNELVAKMSELLRTFKLNLETMTLERTIGIKRVEVKGETFRLVNNDSVLELGGADGAPKTNTVDAIITSVPFGTQYEYTAQYEDFGFNDDNGKFFEQMDYLVPNLLEVLKPGRLACIHVKDRIRFGNVTGKGVPTVDRFSDKTADCFEKHGFDFLGRITIDTDVVRENAQTYRLGWSENAKDGTKMGVGLPEYVLLFRKPQTDLSRAYADVPVVKDKSVYMRAHWQVDASEFWKSDGNRLPDPELLLNLSMDAIGRLWREHARKNRYDWNEHVEVAAELEALGKLPASFMLFPPISNHPGIWTDIARMRVLNTEQERRRAEKHVCPLQLDIANRLITRYSNPGEIVLDPFNGIGTVCVCAINLGRKAYGIELSHDYWACSVGYCEQAERERKMPTLFDLVKEGVVTI